MIHYTRKIFSAFLLQFFQIIIAQAAVTAVEKWVFANGAFAVQDKAGEFFSCFAAEFHAEAVAGIVQRKFVFFHFGVLDIFYDTANLICVTNFKAFAGIAVENGNQCYVG